MADVTWSKTTPAGNVLDTQGNVVGTSDGAGVITINVNTDVEVGPANDTLTITEGVTVKFPVSTTRRGFDVNASGSTSGTLRIEGTQTEPVILTSAAASPAPGDWRGIRWTGGTTSNGGFADLKDCEMHYCQTCLQSQNAAGFVKNRLTAFRCLFQNFNTGGAFNSAGQGGSFPWTISYCCFVACSSLAASQFLVNCTSGGTPTGSDRAKIILNYCSFLLSASSVDSYNILSLGARSDMEATNCIFVGSNVGVGTVNLLDITSATGPVMTNNNNFYFVDAVLDYSADATDQNVDPSYFASCPTPDLRPDAQVGDPLLYLASEDGIFVGAKTPYNLPDGADIDPEGTTGVWSGKTQRVYEVGFGETPMRGRAIRIGVTATDLNGEKLLAGIMLRGEPERLK